jgi:hypothetical protein
MGRIKLGANVLGAAKKAITDSVRYANERKQFGVLISTFGSIKYKLAEQVIRLLAAESAVYRVSKDIDDLMEKLKVDCGDKGRASIEAISHYAVEAAILKVAGSEMLDYIADEAVQIHGGMGYSAEMAVERGYRDSRINRIFEGTNEINRILVVDTAMKRAMKGEFSLFPEAEKLYNSASTIKDENTAGLSYFVQKMHYIKNFKKLTMMCIHGALKKFEKGLVNEQEVLNNITDMMMDMYQAESLLLRAEKREALKGSAPVYRDIVDVYFYDVAARIRKAGFDAINSFATPDESADLLNAADLFTRTAPVNIKDARRRIADRLIEDNQYRF